MRIAANHIHGNGQIGIVGKGDNIQIEGNILAHNNYAGFSTSWEAGGAKLVKTSNLVLRGNCVHDNTGTGLWTDIGNIHSLYEGNRVFANSSEGIHHEISYDAVIRGNTVFANGYGYDSWLFGAQILINTSRNVEVHDNHVEVARGYGDGIALIQQEREDGRFGEARTSGNRVHGNTVVYRGPNGVSGAAGDYDNEALFSSGNRFYENSYMARDGDEAHWAWGEPFEHRVRYMTWPELRQTGQEADGRLELQLLKPLDRKCANMAVGPKHRPAGE
jgi:parallel beta-helix repeat protein